MTQLLNSQRPNLIVGPGEARARGTVYGLLSRLFLREPTVSFLEGLANSGAVKALSRVGGKWMMDLPGMDLEGLAEALSTEYARLFLGPGRHAHPYESMYSSAEGSGWRGAMPQLCGAAATAAEEFYLRAGVVPDPGFQVLPDHIGVELEFMSRLVFREACHWEGEEVESALSSLQLQRTFLSEHLVPWLPRLRRNVARFEPHPFYRAVVATTCRFTRIDLQTVEELLKQPLALEGTAGELR